MAYLGWLSAAAIEARLPYVSTLITGRDPNRNFSASQSEAGTSSERLYMGTCADPTEKVKYRTARGEVSGSVVMCLKRGCKKPAIISPDFEEDYCSSDCLVEHCGYAFREYVEENKARAATQPMPAVTANKLSVPESDKPIDSDKA